MKWYLIKGNARCGAFNMAMDYFFLENPPDIPLLRFYSWSPAAITFGYNQRNLYFNKEQCDQLGIDIIRRPTGGRAVYHNREITYSVIIPSNSELFALNINELHKRISSAILTGLQQLNIPVNFRVHRSNNNFKPNDINPCFESTSKYEICYNDNKLVGSAQRKTRKAALQQGSILLKNEQSVLYSLLSKSNNQINETDDPNLEYYTLIDEKLYDKDQIIENIIQGFENEFKTHWISEIDLSGFKLNEKRETEQAYLYKAQFHEVSDTC